MTEQTIIRAERRAKAIDLLGGECVKCGSIEHLEFDHIKNDREDYAHMLGHLLGSCSWARIVVELKKCQLLCHDCHLAKTHVDRGNFGQLRHGTLYGYQTQKCRCDDCKHYWTMYQRNWRKRQIGVIS